MRNLALLLLVVLALLLVLKFFPSGEAQGADGAEGSGTPFLERPRGDAGEDSPDLNQLPEAPGTAVAEFAVDVAPRSEPSQPEQEVPARGTEASQGETPVEWDPRREVGLAGAMLHGTTSELDSAIAAMGRALPRGRAALARAFHRAMAGDPDRALSLAATVVANATTEDERQLLELALGGRGNAPQPASYSTRNGGPVARAMALGLREREAAMALEDGQYDLAARHYSDVLKVALDSPWRVATPDLKRWSSALHQAQERHRWSPRSEWESEDVEVRRGDSLVRIRLRYIEGKPDAQMCTGLIEKANRLSSSTIHPGDPLRIPTARVTVLVDLSARWLLYMHDGEVVYSWQVAIGRPGEETIEGDFTIGEKLPEPPWTRVGKAVVPYGHPDNPLGTHWLTWVQDGRKTSYGFHGTKEPESLGTEASDGCVRLHNDNIALLYELMPKGASFTVRQ
ncbi:MAG: hypothetical protein ACI8QS_001131 [Planctomycetota bacterium]|jgi:hypothetical protein